MVSYTDLHTQARFIMNAVTVIIATDDANTVKVKVQARLGETQSCLEGGGGFRIQIYIKHKLHTGNHPWLLRSIHKSNCMNIAEVVYPVYAATGNMAYVFAKCSRVYACAQRPGLLRACHSG